MCYRRSIENYQTLRWISKRLTTRELIQVLGSPRRVSFSLLEKYGGRVTINFDLVIYRYIF